MNSDRKGRLAEFIAEIYLRLLGYRILARRYRTPVGEIDLIARRRGFLIFIEVKTRQKKDQAVAAIAPASYRRLQQAAHHYMQRYQGQLFWMRAARFDLVALAPPCYLIHLDNIDLTTA
jgi:putative endonuclease